jgi:type I restriction enzyme M protein
MVRLGLMNLMMHGIDEPHIDYKDTLSKSYTEEAEYDIVMANPPFTGSIDKGDINENLQLATTKTELLFVENIYRLLKKGGTACVIVPQGVLFGSGGAFKTLRQMLVERCDLKAVITLPSGVFKPYAGVSTAILLFTKVWGPKDKVSQARHRTRLVLRNGRRRLFAGRQAQQAGRLLATCKTSLPIPRPRCGHRHRPHRQMLHGAAQRDCR